MLIVNEKISDFFSLFKNVNEVHNSVKKTILEEHNTFLKSIVDAQYCVSSRCVEKWLVRGFRRFDSGFESTCS